ncbi:unnamed protein product, partial [Rotaria sp. Silwood2]
LPYPVLDRFRLQIISKIHHKVKWLNLESSPMRRFLLGTNCPNLSGLELHVSLSSFTNCLYLLDEHFNQLRTFYINISTITSRLKVNNKVGYFV